MNLLTCKVKFDEILIERGIYMEIQLSYLEKGNKENESLILLHGNGEDGTYFKNQIEYFSKSYRVFAIDTRGHGKSPRGDAPFTIRQFAQDLHQFMDDMNIEKANILGFSDGGNIALIFAIKYPQRVSRLILNGANLDAKGVKPTVQIPITIGYKLASLFAKRDPKAKKKAELLGLMIHDPNIKEDELRKIQIKTLVIAGTKDLIKKTHTVKIYENLPRAEIDLVEGDHFVARDNPLAFNKKVEEFLQ